MHPIILPVALILLGMPGIVPALASAGNIPRHITFEERVRAQESIERVYYHHQIGATRPFEMEIPREILVKKVSFYLKESVALERIWDTPITAAMLHAELERIARGTRFPERLTEIRAALGNDSVLMEETLVRATLADRLARSFFAGDERTQGAGWDAWWAREQQGFDETLVETAAAGEPVPVSFAPSGSCGPSDVWDNASLDDLPDSRPNPTAVWTGTVMIVWGGGDFENPNIWPPGSYNTGGRYDPLTDTWSPMSTLNAPAARFGHTAVWTGTEMIVWGGYDDVIFKYFGDGGRYSPVTDTWTALPAVGAPIPRHHHTAVWTGGEMVVWGGRIAVTPFRTDTGARYNPSTNLWTTTSAVNVPPARSNHRAVWTGSEMIVAGGSGSTAFASGARYNPATDTWTTMAAAPATREDLAVWTGTEMIVWGGGHPNGTGKRYRPATNTWTLMATLNSPSLDPSAAGVWTGTELIVSGFCGQVPCAAGRYDPASDHWSSSTSLNAPARRKNHVAVWSGDRMIVWGGYAFGAAAGNSATNSGGRYDPATDSWTPTSVGGAPAPRSLHSSVWTGNVVIVWSGGTGGRYDPLTDSWVPTSTVNAPGGGVRGTAVWTGTRMIVWGWGTTAGGRYDPVADSWSPTSTVGAPSIRFNYATVWTGSEMIVWGGQDSTAPGLNTGARYNAGFDTWTPVATAGAPSGREYYTSVWSGTEMIVWGGDAGSGILFNSGGRYNPVTDSWTPTSTTNAPAGRHYHSAVWTGSEMIVWGGIDANFILFNDGGRYNPVMDTWTPTSTAGAPSRRASHTGIWTGREMMVWGGYLSYYSHQFKDGGRYNPGSDTWMPITVSGSPAARYDHTAVWTGDNMFIWGGADGFAYFNSGGRYLPGPEPDRDGDGLRVCDGDCDDTNAQVWATPGEVTLLDLSADTSTLSWSPPAAPGGASIVYDTLRSTAPFDFGGISTCLESHGSDAMSADTSAPPPGGVYYYLVRAENTCSGSLGMGSLGTDSSGTQRTGRTCP